MKHLLTIIIVGVLGSTFAAAEVPVTPSYNEYSHLLKRSPFIIKKVESPVVKPPPNNSLTLRGVSRFKDGWIVTLVDRKAPKTNIILREGQPAKDGLRLLKVNQSKGDFGGTTAEVLSGNRQITVAFKADEIRKRYKQSSKASAITSNRKKSTSNRKQSNKRPPLPVRSSATQSKTPKKASSGRRPRVRRTPVKK